MKTRFIPAFLLFILQHFILFGNQQADIIPSTIYFTFFDLIFIHFPRP